MTSQRARYHPRIAKRIALHVLGADGTYILSLIRDHLRMRCYAWYKTLLHGHVARRARIADYLRGREQVKLHLGAGFNSIPGFLDSDLVEGNLPVDITRKLPFPSDSVDLIYTNHVIEHIHKEEFKFFLKESRRVLKPGGLNVISTPSLEKVVRVLYGRDEQGIELLRQRHGPSMTEECFTASQYINYLMKAYGHKYIYDGDFICRLAAQAGYGSARRVDHAEVPDEELRAYLLAKAGTAWEVQTETFMLVK